MAPKGIMKKTWSHRWTRTPTLATETERCRERKKKMNPNKNQKNKKQATRRGCLCEGKGIKNERKKLFSIRFLLLPKQNKQQQKEQMECSSFFKVERVRKLDVKEWRWRKSVSFCGSQGLCIHVAACFSSPSLPSTFSSSSFFFSWGGGFAGLAGLLALLALADLDPEQQQQQQQEEEEEEEEDDDDDDGGGGGGFLVWRACLTCLLSQI